MSTAGSQLREATSPTAAVLRVGCVSFLNARPLIEGLDADNCQPPVELSLDVPSCLLADLEAGRTDVALCPVIDFYRSRVPLQIVPVGGIASLGTTLTVKLCSGVPIDSIERIYADTDSHTSVALVQIVLAERYGIRPQVIAYNAREQTAMGRWVDRSEAVLLIGDKVVAADTPSYPYELDLGQAWHELANLPFVFAVWMSRRGTALGELPQILTARRIANARHLDAIVRKHAAAHGWPQPLAARYLKDILKYEIGPTQLQAIEVFATKAHRLGLIGQLEPMAVYAKPVT